MGVSALNPSRYGRLCAELLPKVIESEEEFDRLAAKLEELTFLNNPGAEEIEMAKLLEKLLQVYDDEHYELPPAPPKEALRFLLEQRGLRPVDLAPVVGSRSQVSEILSGKRAISKAQAKKLAAFFRTSTDLFL
jgi:HTH-type transcriptional regulator / antitoxin HigA